eukprot:scaffold17_cov83-Cylindrotheca_fusiformis.AAC.4
MNNNQQDTISADAANEKHSSTKKNTTIVNMNRNEQSTVEEEKAPLEGASFHTANRHGHVRSTSLIPPASSETVEKYKKMIRSRISLQSADEIYEDFGRSQEFYGKSELLESPSLDRKTRTSKAGIGSATTSPKHNKLPSRSSIQSPKKWGKPDLQARPSEWLGSPASATTKRKSYKIKEEEASQLAKMIADIPLTDSPTPVVSTPSPQHKTKTVKFLEPPSSVQSLGDHRSAFHKTNGTYKNKMISASDSRLMLLSPGSNNDSAATPRPSSSEWLESPVLSSDGGSGGDGHRRRRRKSYRIKNVPVSDIAPPVLSSPPFSPNTVVSRYSLPSSNQISTPLLSQTPPSTPVESKARIGEKRFSALHQMFESPNSTKNNKTAMTIELN